MMKRIIVLFWVTLVTMAVMAQGADWPVGRGTQGDPYQINNAQDLKVLATNVNAGNSYSGTYFLLTSDIDLVEFCNATLGESWTPIGTGNNGFAGVFDGDNHVITGLYIDSPDSRQGLFGHLNGGVVSRCVIRGGSVAIAGNYGSAGILVGYSKNGIIQNCIVEGANLSGNYSSSLGLIAGSIHGTRVLGNYVTDCVVKGGVHKGAVVGYKAGKSNFQKNFYTATVTGAEGGCDGKDINNSKNSDGAVRTSRTAQEMAALTTAVAVQPTADTTIPAAASSSAQAPALAQTPQAAQTPETKAATPSEPVSSQALKTLIKSAPAVKTVESSYIVKTKDAIKPERKAAAGNQGSSDNQESTEPQDFMGKNFPYYTMCEWRKGMRFMVVPERVDLLVNTFCDADTKKEVGNGKLRHHIMVYQGHEEALNGREHVLFTDEGDNKKYYFELPLGSFEDYCYTKKGIPALAFLEDVDKARELLMGQQLLTRTKNYRADISYESDDFKEVTVPLNEVVTVKAVGVGTRAFPVKIVVEDAEGTQFYQNVTMSKTNCGMRNDEFIMGNERFLFEGSFAYGGGIMAIVDDLNYYIGKTVHTNHPTTMNSKGSGKMRVVKVPRFTGFIIDAITPLPNSHYCTLTMRESESRRVYTKDVAFTEKDINDEKKGTFENDYFGYVFGMGEGAAKETSVEIRAAIREGRVIRGMTKEQVEMAMGEANQKEQDNGEEKWMYNRSNGVIFEVWFDNHTGLVRDDKARLSAEEAKRRAAAAKKKKAPSGKHKSNNARTTEVHASNVSMGEADAAETATAPVRSSGARPSARAGAHSSTARTATPLK